MEYHSLFDSYVLGRAEEYDTSKVQCWSFKKVTDIVHGVECRFSNMAGGFPFEFGGRTWQNSEVLYLCGEFSNDTERHRQIQQLLLTASSGFAAKRFYKNPNKQFVRADFADFRLQWMLFTVWQKCKGNEDFRDRLLQVPDGVILIEDTTTDRNDTAEIWGCKNKELLQMRKSLLPSIEAEAKTTARKKKDIEHIVNVKWNEVTTGPFRGQNNMGKILMMCRAAIKFGVEPPIDYDLLERSNIYIFGEKVDFSAMRQQTNNRTKIMKTEKIEDNMEQNDGRITLMDGSVIQGYTPQRVADQRIDNSMELDTTGEYFSIKRTPQPQKRKSAVEEGRYFLDYAFFFLSHAKEILSDSRMFLARVPVVNGLAYTGTGGFRAPTLGVYLEWWNSCSDSVIELDGEKWLVWFISGSPLSGANACAIVNEKGETQTYRKLNFYNIWTSFTKINTRYDEAKGKYAYFTLEEVVNIVRNNDEDKDKRGLMLDCFFLRSCNRGLAQRLQKSEERCKKLQNELSTAKIRLNIDWYRDVYCKYKEAEEAYLKRREELKSQRRELRKRLKSGELNNIEYQHLFQPISKELRSTSCPSSSYDWDLRQKDADVSLYDVEHFFNKEDSKQD